MLKCGLIGKNGSGKSSVCGYLKSLGFVLVSLSDMIRQEARLKGLPEDRDTLTNLGNEMKEKEGLDVLAKKAYQTHEQDELLVIDSIRHPKEAAYLKEKGVKLIGIEVSQKVRYERIKNRASATDQVDFETFVLQDDRESSGKSSGQNITKTLTYCDIIIQNDRSELVLFQAIDQWLGKEKT